MIKMIYEASGHDKIHLFYHPDKWFWMWKLENVDIC